MESNEQKIKYHTPQIKCIRIDTEISLALESTPPEGPMEYGYNKPEFFNNNNNPIKNV